MKNARLGSRHAKHAEHGIVLGIVIMTAVIFSIAAYAMLMTAMNQRQRAKEFDVDRLRARYAAEAGLVWAQERLWADPTFCVGSPPFNPINGLTVTVTVSGPCPGPTHKITARVTY